MTTCEPKKPTGSTVNIYGTQVWAKWTADDESCTPTWAEQGNTQDINMWQDKGCQGDGSKKYTRRVLNQGLSDETAVNHLLTLVPQIDETLFEYQVNIDIIEKDYPDEQLKNIDYEQRKNRRSKEHDKLKTELERRF